jgi:hypothetical protein
MNENNAINVKGNIMNENDAVTLINVKGNIMNENNAINVKGNIMNENDAINVKGNIMNENDAINVTKDIIMNENDAINVTKNIIINENDAINVTEDIIMNENDAINNIINVTENNIMTEENLLRKFRNLSLKDPKNDILFKNIFGQKCNEKKLISFLNAIISNDDSNKNKSTEINEIDYCNVELHTSKYSEKERTTIVDIHAKDNTNKVDYLIEMQVLKDKDMPTRSEFNSSKIYQTFFEKGKPLRTDQKVYSINILYFNIFHPNEKNYKKYFHTLFTHEIGDIKNSINNQIYIFIELPRFKYSYFEKDNILHYWLSFLKAV